MRAFALLLLVCVAGQSVDAQEASDWTRFLGPNGSGIADGQKPPVTFGPDDKVLWKQVLPPGHSTPIVWRDRIFLTTGNAATETLRSAPGLALMRSGLLNRVREARRHEPHRLD